MPDRPDYPTGFGVNVIGHISSALGLGVSARATISALLGNGIPVATVDFALSQVRHGYDNSYSHLGIRQTAQLPYPVTLVHCNPKEARAVWQQFPHWFANTHNAIVPFFEMPDPPESWIAELTKYDTIFAATRYVASAMSNAVSTPVRMFPLTAQLGEVETVDRSEYGIPEDKVAFAANYDTDSGFRRKNGLGLLRAFEAALDLGADAVLVLKLLGGNQNPILNRALARLPQGSVIVVNETLPYSRVLGLYAACDAYVSLHRAEGLGLGMQEAMLLGKPVVATGWSGNVDFMDDSCAALIPYTLTPAVDDHPDYGPQNFTRQQLWAEPDVLDAGRHLLRLAEDEGLREQMGEAGKQRIQAYGDAWVRGLPEQMLRFVTLDERLIRKSG